MEDTDTDRVDDADAAGPPTIVRVRVPALFAATPTAQASAHARVPIAPLPPLRTSRSQPRRIEVDFPIPGPFFFTLSERVRTQTGFAHALHVGAWLQVTGFRTASDAVRVFELRPNGTDHTTPHDLCAVHVSVLGVDSSHPNGWAGAVKPDHCRATAVAIHSAAGVALHDLVQGGDFSITTVVDSPTIEQTPNASQSAPEHEPCSDVPAKDIDAEMHWEYMQQTRRI